MRYLLVSQGMARMEHYRRSDAADGSWQARSDVQGAHHSATLHDTGVVEAIYEGAFDVPGDAPRPADTRTGDD